MTRPVYIALAQRSALGKAHKGMFAKKRPDDLLADLIRQTVVLSPKLDLAAIDDVIIGCAMPEAEQGMNIARISALLAGLPESVPGMTINRFCSSGAQSIAIAADRIAAGRADIILAGGVESMSMIPMGGNKLSGNPHFFDNNEQHIGIAYGMGVTGEKVAEQFNISREAQDQFAYDSHRKALKAIKDGNFENEILPIDVTSRIPNLKTGEVDSKAISVNKDEGPRGDTSIDKLAQLKPAFAQSGSITAGNSSQISDGAGVVLVCSEAALKKYDLTPLAKFVDYSVIGLDPKIMGVGPIYAIPKVLKSAGIKQDQLDWIELNEAFASQSLAVINELKLDPVKVNPCGGAIALGHPLGATGAILTVKCLHGLQRTQGKYGMVTMCVGTGMGFAAIFEHI